MSHNRVETSKGNVMIVDDTPANLRLLSQMLTEQGYHVRPVPDGQLALEAVWAEPPDLILLDIRMPGMNGYEVCERLKADNRTDDIPIIFISALDALQDKVKAFTIGGVDYITKPFQVEEVLARVKTHLTLLKFQQQLQDANRKMSQELAIAGDVQTSFLPQDLPKIPGWQLAAMLKPAREMSGDFYDFICFPNRRLGIVIGDVCDKGAGAALYMALSCTLIRTYAAEFPEQPQNVLHAVNRRILKDTKTKFFVTLFFGVLDLDTGTFVHCNAGHCWPYLISTDDRKSIRRITNTGVPLGIFEDSTWEQGIEQLDPGDMLVLFTDGVTEARNSQGGFFGEDRLQEFIRANQGCRPEAMPDKLMAEVKRFIGGIPQEDDIALVVLHRDSIR